MSNKTPYFIPGEINPRCPDCLSAMREIQQFGFISIYLCNDCKRTWKKDYSQKGGDNNANTSKIKSETQEE